MNKMQEYFQDLVTLYELDDSISRKIYVLKLWLKTEEGMSTERIVLNVDRIVFNRQALKRLKLERKLVLRAIKSLMSDALDNLGPEEHARFRHARMEYITGEKIKN